MPRSEVEADNTAVGVDRVTAAFDAFADEARLPSIVIGAVQVVLDELLSNTVKAGYPDGGPGRIEAAFEVVDGYLQITLVDDGIAFDPLERADPDTEAALEDRPIGGLGIYLVKQLMDRVDYERVGRHNRLRLVKSLEEPV
ncbi:MAG: ATP-binding protein [Vicinamibacteria bacterium]|nr:ATP-binding protein [Vicinamibacteria bacterium]